MKKYLFLLLWANFVGIHGEEAFTCDNTGEECPSKMCYYGIDHEHSCYRAGCATEEQCAGRRHNECFISKGLHTCCCMERGCAASYKGQNDCVYETKNSSDTGITTTSAADVTTTMEATNSTKKIDRLATENDSPSRMREVPPMSEEDDYSDSVGAESEEEQEAITSTEKETATSAVTTTTSITSTEALPTSTPVRETSTTTVTTTRATRPPPPPSTTTQTTTTTTSPTTSTTSTTTTTTQTTTTTTTTTPRPTTRTTERTTTTPKMEEIRFLPDMPHVQQLPESEEETTTRRPTTTTSTRATTATSTTPKTTTSAERRVPVLERAREIEPARAEKSKFISAAAKNDDVADRSVSESESSTQANDDKRSSPSLITVYEVTTSAVKNREVHETYKPPVPWWVAVAVGFIVSVVIAWAVVILLRKRKLREAEAANRKSTDKEAAVVDPLLKPSEVPEH